ncbi:MAG: TonB-dependent receptor [Deltaproteobacteria bacterium]
MPCSARLSWRGEGLSFNLGAETSRSILDYRDSSPGVPPFWGPYQDIIEPVGKEERRGIYANATWTVGDFALSPGLRYDYSSTSQEFVSPSLGATWKVREDTLLRATVTRGFSAPYLATFIFGNNPDLKPEKIWSYQAGVETNYLPMVYLKATVFHQQVEDVWYLVEVPWRNQGRTRWDGVDLEVKSVEFKGFAATANFSYILEDSVIDQGGSPLDLNDDKLYGGNLIIDYRHRQYNITAQLAGHYVHWNTYSLGEFPRDDTWLWDFTVGKTFVMPHLQPEVFASVHNLTNASQFWDFEYANPNRWVEAGVKVNY